MNWARWNPFGRRQIFRDREEAGRALGQEVAKLGSLTRPIVLALPRGGVTVAARVAEALDAPLDVLIVRKLGHPLQPELAIGAIASGGIRVLNAEVMAVEPLPEETVDAVAEREARELERRERAYRGDAPPLDVEGRSVAVVDDGLATGSTMSAAVLALRRMSPREIVVAVPLAPRDTCARLEREADRIVCLHAPEPFVAIGVWYADFPQLEDDQVRAELERASARRDSRRTGREPS